MMWRRTLRNATLALAGLAVAVGVGLAANAVSEDSIGLSAQPLEASDSLAPAEARRGEPRRERRAQRRRTARRRANKPRAATAPAQAPAPAPAPAAVPPPARTTSEPAADDAGKSRVRGGDSHDSDDDRSGSGGSDDSGDSDNSGSGSSDDSDDSPDEDD